VLNSAAPRCGGGVEAKLLRGSISFAMLDVLGTSVVLSATLAGSLRFHSTNPYSMH
jgi:hypothetical protein